MKIGYQNVGGGNKQQHAWLEECWQREVDVIFIGECYIPKRGLGMMNMMGYELVTKVKAGTRVVVYSRQGMGDICEVIMDEVDAIGIKWQGRKIVGVYGRTKVEGGSRRYGEWVRKVADTM